LFSLICVYSLHYTDVVLFLVAAVEELFWPNDPNDRQKGGDSRSLLQYVTFVWFMFVSNAYIFFSGLTLGVRSQKGIWLPKNLNH